MAGGRPTKYNRKYCGMAVEFLGQGYSVTAFAGYIGVSRATVFKWASENKEFSDSLKRGQALAALWWEQVLRGVAKTGEGNASAAIFGVKNRSREEWRDKQEVEHSGNPDAPVQIVERVILREKAQD